MNIDYAKIIETANKRKETLEALTETLRGLEDCAEKLAGVSLYMRELSGRYDAIDTEGRKLLPPGFDDQMGFLRTKLLHITETYSVYHGAYRAYVGLAPLLTLVSPKQEEQQ